MGCVRKRKPDGIARMTFLGLRAFAKAGLFAAIAEAAPLKGSGVEVPAGSDQFLKKHCFECHDSAMAEGGLNMEALESLGAKGGESLEQWVKIHDRVEAGEMPPPKK